MGLIRKSLALGTVGVVNPSSKKQRVAKATQRAVETNTRATAKLAAQQAEANRQAAQRAQVEHDFRYATDVVYRKYIDDKQAAEEAARVAEVGRLAEVARVRRERRQQRNATAVRVTGRTLAIVAAAAVLPVAAVIVWLPQLAVAQARHTTRRLWLSSLLTQPFRHQRKSQG